MRVERHATDGTRQAWEVPHNRAVFTFVFVIVSINVVGFGLEIATRPLLTYGQREIGGLVTAIPTIWLSAILGWKIGGRFWPGKPIDTIIPMR